MPIRLAAGVGAIAAVLASGCGGDDRTLSDALDEAPCELPATNEEFAEALQSKPNPGFLDIQDFGNGTDYEEFVTQASDDQLAELCGNVGQPRG